ncbi:unnamed protein product [Alopecurus aequalis]
MAPPRGVDQLAKLFDGAVAIRDSPPPRRNKNAGKVDEDDDCVILDGDPHRPVAVAVATAKGRSASDDEVEIVAVRGEIACKDFPHSRHVCSEFPFSTTSHRKHCSMCYCFVRLHANIGAKVCREYYQEHTSEEDRVEDEQQDYYEEYTSEEYRVENEEEYFDPDEEATVCVGNLPFDIDSEFLGQLFEYAGNVVSSEIIYDTESGQSCGYGYVTMSTAWEAENAVKDYHLRELYGRLVTVRKAAVAASGSGAEEETPSPPVSSSFKLYVCNLPWEVDSSELKQLFSGYGEVVHAKVLYNGRGAQRRSRGFGFVTMATQEGSEAAIWDLDKQVWRGRKLRVRVASEEGSR